MVTFYHSSQNQNLPLIHSGYKAHQKDLACIQSLLSKNAIERVENVKSLRFFSCLFLVPKPHQRWRPVIDLSKLNALPTCRKVQNGNSRFHQGLSDSRGMGVGNRHVRRLSSHPHPPKLKKIPKVLPQVSGVPVHLPPFRPSHGPTSLYNDYKEVKLMAPTRGVRLDQYPDDWLFRAQSQKEAQVNTRGRRDTVLRVDNKSGEARTLTDSCFCSWAMNTT